MNPRYRPEIDGLRAIAVLPVILFHAGFGLFSGGFVGVDVFFVISGYLITLIIHEEIGSGNFSIVAFYERRVRRILPALFATCLACIPFAWLWMMPDEFEDFSQSLVAVNLFASNILFWREIDYFAPSAELKPLLHTWSLAVEEQFYIFFPLFLLIFRKLRTSILAILLVAAICLSLGLSEWASHTHHWANFYLLPTRAWELGAGGVIAVLFGQQRPEDRALREGGAALGMALILFAIFFYDGTIRFPGLSAAVPVLGAVLIIACARSSDITGQMLSWRPLVWIGLISYSAYLWHQPVFAFARMRSLVPLSVPVLVALSLFSLGLAYLSWRFVEHPFRDKKKFSRRAIFSISLAAAAALMALGAMGYLTMGFPGRLNADAQATLAYGDASGSRAAVCDSSTSHRSSSQSSCTYNAESTRKAVLWGDSHAGAIVNDLAEALSPHGVSLRNLTLKGCPPVFGYETNSGQDACFEHNEAVFEFLENDKSIDTVILFWRWTRFLEGKPFDNGEGGVETGGDETLLPAMVLARGEKIDSGDQNTRAERVGAIYRGLVNSLIKLEKNVVLVYPVPEAGWDVPIRLAREIHYGVERTESLSVSSEVFRQRNEATLAQLDMLTDSPKLIRIRPDDIFCDTFVPGRCVLQLETQPLYFDDDHLSRVGSSMLANKIVREMSAREWADK